MVAFLLLKKSVMVKSNDLILCHFQVQIGQLPAIRISSKKEQESFYFLTYLKPFSQNLDLYQKSIYLIDQVN